VLCHARLHSKAPNRVERLLPTLRKRTAFIYPLFALGLLLSLLVEFWRGNKLPKWWVVLSQAFLCQSFLPWLPEASVQIHCWFLSAMVPQDGQSGRLGEAIAGHHGLVSLHLKAWGCALRTREEMPSVSGPSKRP
tara:strand:+ start:441 stop:845 length:405 start_codon:yes stop_codon:yes gene_type:complete